MLDLEGSLEIFGPIAVMQMIHLAQASGELELDTFDNSARVYFERGNVTFAGISSRPMRLGDALLKEKRIKKKDLDGILRKRKKEGKKLGVHLVEEGIIGEDELRQAVEEQIKEVIYEIVRWLDGRFTFTSGKKPKAQDILIDIPLDYLMLEGLKRLDEEKEQA